MLDIFRLSSWDMEICSHPQEWIYRQVEKGEMKALRQKIEVRSSAGGEDFHLRVLICFGRHDIVIERHTTYHVHSCGHLNVSSIILDVSDVLFRLPKLSYFQSAVTHFHPCQEKLFDPLRVDDDSQLVGYIIVDKQGSVYVQAEAEILNSQGPFPSSDTVVIRNTILVSTFHFSTTCPVPSCQHLIPSDKSSSHHPQCYRGEWYEPSTNHPFPQ